MDYMKLYDSLINNRRNKGTPSGYKERHHVVPKSLGGSNDSDNIVALTAREHFVAHLLLAKIHPTTGMVHAVYKMACIGRKTGKYKVTNRVYEQLRIAHAHRVSTDEVAKARKSLAGKGKKQTLEHIAARTKSRKDNGEWHNVETKRKISESNKGKVGTWSGKKMPPLLVARRNETRRKNGNYEWSKNRKKAQSDRLRGKPVNRSELTDEQKQKLRKEKTRLVQCPFCHKSGTMLIMPRWHFANCKQNPSKVLGQ